MAAPPKVLYGGFDGGTRNSAAAYLDEKGRLKNLSWRGGGVHVSNVPFVRTALQLKDATVQKLHAKGLIYCSLANARDGLTRAHWYAFLDEIVDGCVFGLNHDTTEHLMVDGWKYDLGAGSSLEFISDHAFRAKRHLQEGKTTYELKGRQGETIYIYPCFLHTLFVRRVLRTMVATAGLHKDKDGKLESLTRFFNKLSVTVPNAYDENTKEEIKDIFDAAGVPKAKVIIFNESLAGMLGYIHLNLEELRELIQEAGRPIIVCNLDCGSQTNDASLFEIALNAETDKFQVKVLAYQANRASGEALTEALMQEVIKEFKAARPREHHEPDYFVRDARRLVEEFKVAVMGTPDLADNPDSMQEQVMHQTVEKVSLGNLHGVDIQVRTKAIWDIYQNIARQVCEPVFKMLTWFKEGAPPRIDALIYTGGGTKSAVMRMLVERLLYDGGKGPLINAEALSNDKLDLDLMVARGAAIFGAGKGGRTQFMYDGDDKEVLNVSAVDVLPGRVLLADHGEDKQLRYTPVLEQFAPPGTKHRWLNIAQVDPSLVFCLKMDTGYAAASDIFNAPFGVRLPNAILGKPFMGEFEYLGDGKIAFQIYPVCCHKSCEDVKEPRPIFKDGGAFYCGKHKPVGSRAVNLKMEFPPATLSFEAFARKPGISGVYELNTKFVENFLKPYYRELTGEAQSEYKKALHEVIDRLKKDLRRKNATVSDIGDSVLYRLLIFAGKHKVPIVTKDMKEQLTPPVVETRTTRKSQSAAAGGGEAASSKGKKRTRNDAAAAAKAASAAAAAAASASAESDDEEGRIKSPKTPRRAELDGQEVEDAAAVLAGGFR